MCSITYFAGAGHISVVHLLELRIFPLEMAVEQNPVLSMCFSMHWDFTMSSQDMTEMIMWPLTMKTSLQVALLFFLYFKLFFLGIMLICFIEPDTKVSIQLTSTFSK